jgi:hypothetical protein
MLELKTWYNTVMPAPDQIMKVQQLKLQPMIFILLWMHLSMLLWK